jgi:hypothetical protein
VVNLIGTDHLGVVAISAVISLRLVFQALSFFVRIETQAIKESEAFTGHKDRDLGPKLNVVPHFTANNRPDIRLVAAVDAIRDASAVSVLKNVLLSDQLVGNQELLIGISPSRQKAGTTDVQGIDAGQITLEMAKLLLDRFADLVNLGSLLLGHGQ